MILVTGGTGLTGSNLIVYLAEKNIFPRVFTRNEQAPAQLSRQLEFLSPGASKIVEQLDFCYGDITNSSDVDEAFRNITKVYHCSGLVSFNTCDRKQLLNINIGGTANIVNACLKYNVEKLLYVSSVAAVKTPEKSDLITESAGWPIAATIDYSYSKTQGEYEVWRGIAEGLNAVIVNPSIILGYGDPEKGSSAIFGKIAKGLNYYTIGITGYVSANDLAKVMFALMESEIHSERFIVNAENMTYQDIFTKIASAMGVKPPEKYASPWMTEFAWRFERALEILVGKKARLTRKAAKAAHSIQHYSSEKLMNAIPFQFAPIEQSILEISEQYRRHYQK